MNFHIVKTKAISKVSCVIHKLNDEAVFDSFICELTERACVHSFYQIFCKYISICRYIVDKQNEIISSH